MCPKKVAAACLLLSERRLETVVCSISPAPGVKINYKIKPSGGRPGTATGKLQLGTPRLDLLLTTSSNWFQLANQTKPNHKVL